ncbi:MAG TPA: hypothetical protein VFI57_12645, partial [Pyrinomonadaceae bacterium]|nr:hypothetical protein [Pyrinomonadaceae bacterium]
ILIVALSTTHLDRINKIFHDGPAKSCKSCPGIAPQSSDLSVEVFQVLDLPLNVHEASLTKNERSYLLKLTLANSSELKIIGLRYSLAVIDPQNQLQIFVNRTEGFSIPGYGIKTLTFKSPIKFKQKDGERLVLMIEQVISRESIWEVVKAKDALEAYAHGDYSVTPSVMRVTNQVDSRPGEQIIYRLRKN